MKLITTREQLEKNIVTFNNYLFMGTLEQKTWAIRRMLECSYFIIYSINNELQFAPSIFVGYVDNSINKHDSYKEKHGTKTKNTINKLLKCEPVSDRALFEEYFKYCEKINIEKRENGVCNQSKKFWNEILCKTK